MKDLEKYKVENSQEKEMLNVVNKNGNIVGSIEREEGINSGVLLEAIQLWIINPKTKEVLMQKRAANKKNDAGMIDVSASGHVEKGETPIQAMLREAYEEIGINDEQLYTKMEKIMQVEIDFTKYGRNGKYITHEFLAYLEYPLKYYKKQDEEVDEIFFMDYEKVKAEIRSKNPNMRIPYEKQTEELFSIIDEKLNNLNKDEKNSKVQDK